MSLSVQLVTRGTQPIIRIVEVFPAPLGPRNPNDSPAATSKSTASTATNSPNLLVSPRAWMSGEVGFSDMDPESYTGPAVQRSGTVPVWMVTMPPDIGIQVTSRRPTSVMISAMRSGPG